MGWKLFDVNDGYLENFPAVDANTQYPLSTIKYLAARLAAQPEFSAVHLAQLAHDPPVLESYGQMAAVVLAAGGSTRFGSPKQLHEWEGQALLQHVVMQVLAAPVQQVFVVLGAYFEEIAPLFYGWPVTLINNQDWEQGQSTSMQAGLRACAIGYTGSDVRPGRSTQSAGGPAPGTCRHPPPHSGPHRRSATREPARQPGHLRPPVFPRVAVDHRRYRWSAPVRALSGSGSSGWKQTRVCFWTSTSLFSVISKTGRQSLRSVG